MGGGGAIIGFAKKRSGSARILQGFYFCHWRGSQGLWALCCASHLPRHYGELTSNVFVEFNVLEFNGLAIDSGFRWRYPVCKLSGFSDGLHERFHVYPIFSGRNKFVEALLEVLL